MYRYYIYFWFLILSMKMSIIMSIIKAINDAIITRNDIISTLITILVTSSEITNTDTRLEIMANIDY